MTLFACSPERGTGPYSDPPGGSVTFGQHVAPIIHEHCAGCHRPGGPGPFSLLTYEDVRARAAQVATVTEKRIMPPWLPEPGYGDFEGARRLSDGEIRTLQSWVASGMPPGDLSSVPAPPAAANGWLLSPPDLVMDLAAGYTLPADGPDVFRNFVLPVPLAARRFVRAVEFRPATAGVIHHLTMTVDRTRASRRLDARDDTPGFSGMVAPGAHSPDGHFVGWTPGKLPTVSPDRRSWRLDRGTDLVVQLHMPPTGRPEPIGLAVGLHFADSPPTETPAMIRLGSKTIDIPAGTSRYVVTDTFELPIDVQVLSVYPHAHYLAREMKGMARLPDGTQRWLIYIRNWDFKWQDEYRLREPLMLPRGTVLSMEFVYDNSAANVRNPHSPPSRVVYGPQSSDEMGDLWLQVLPSGGADLAVLKRAYVAKELADDLAGAAARVARDPDDADARNLLASLYQTAGRIPEAIAALRETLRRAPDHFDARNNLGLALAAAGDAREAVDQFRKALAVRPDSAVAHFNLGNVLKAIGAADEALAHFRQAVALDPDHADARNNLGVELGARGLVDEATDEIRQALAIDPDHVDAHSNLGVALWSAGGLDAAAKEFSAALALDPAHADARENLLLLQQQIAARGAVR